MKTLSVGEFKARFSEALQSVRDGEQVGVAYGRTGKLVAVLVGPEAVAARGKLKLGLLRDRAKVAIPDDFQMSDEELLAG